MPALSVGHVECLPSGPRGPHRTGSRKRPLRATRDGRAWPRHPARGSPDSSETRLANARDPLIDFAQWPEGERGASVDDLEAQQVAQIVPNVFLQQFDSLVDLHHEDLAGSEIGELSTGLVDRFELLLLKDLLGDVADRDDQSGERCT